MDELLKLAPTGISLAKNYVKSSPTSYKSQSNEMLFIRLRPKHLNAQHRKLAQGSLGFNPLCIC